MAAISDADVSIDASGNIRWTGAATTNRHTVLEFIQWLMDKQDDDQAAGDDLLDITVDTPFDRSTDQIVTLNSPFNIDDTFATHLYDGSVAQTDPTYGGQTLYSGLNVIGPVEAGTEYMIIQNGKVLPAFWGAGINPEASPSLVFSRHLVKSVFAGSDIDGQRVTVLARELGDQYRRFPVTLGTGNSVAAIGNGSDIFNTTADATIAGWTTISNTEGFQELDIDGTGAAGQEYYSQWNIGSQTINETYERSKWITQRAHVADSTGGTPTGADFVIDDGTTQGQAQSFIAPTSVDEKLVEARFNVKIGAGAPTGTLYCLLYDSDDAASQLAEPTGAALARSEAVLASAITSTYEEVIFRFNLRNPSTGADQSTGLDLVSGTNDEYFIAIHNDEGTGTDYFHVQGASTDQDATMNQASYNGTVWTAVATNDLNMTVKSCPPIHGVPGELFQGINVEVGYDAEGGTGVTENTIVTWGSDITYDTLVGSFIEGEPITVRVDAGGAIRSGGHVLYDDGANMIVALDTLSAGIVATDDIEGLYSGATANVTGITNGDKGGGSGILLALDDNGTAGEVYLQVLSGVNPVDNSIIYDAGSDTNSITATATINTRTINPEFLGTSTGSNIIGAYGIGFQTTDVGASDRFTSLDNASRTPPNNQTFTVSGLVAGEDRVLVAPRTGSTINKTQLATDVTLSGATETTIQCSAAVPSETPASGTLRVELDSGIYKRVRYQSNAGNDYTILADDTFVDGDVNVGTDNVTLTAHSFVTSDKVQLSTTGVLPGGLSTATDYWIIRIDANTVQFASSNANAIAGTQIDITSAAGGGTHTVEVQDFENFSTDNATQPANVFITYIDVLARATSESFTATYTSDRNLFVRVRDGGATPIKTFQSASAQFLSTPQTVAAIRTADV